MPFETTHEPTTLNRVAAVFALGVLVVVPAVAAVMLSLAHGILFGSISTLGIWLAYANGAVATALGRR